MTSLGNISHPESSPAEQLAITAVGRVRQRCICGGGCESEGVIPVTAGTAARFRLYKAQHPGHGFFHDGEGNWAAVVDFNPENPDVRAAPSLEVLLDELGVPLAAALS